MAAIRQDGADDGGTVHGSEKRGQGHREDWLPQSVRDAGVSRVLNPGDFLFRIDTPTVGLFEVIKGRIKLVRIARSGRETILHTAAAGDIVAEASLFSPTYHCDAIAATDSVVRLYPKRSFFAAFREDPAAAQAFMGMLAREVMNLRTRLEQRNIHTARDRVRHYLTLNAGADGRTVVLSGTLKDLAGELGLSHEALYRTLADMAAHAEIERLEGKIRLKSPDV
jgi:CRP/FNR family transcriptional regulator, dissimilatory nitrate respiration regulator